VGVVSVRSQDVFCSTKASWQGGPLRAPVASPRPWLFQGIEPVPEPVERIAVQSLAGDFALPAPIDSEGVPAPEPPDHCVETTSSRPGRGAFALPLPWTHPTDQGAFGPLGTLTNPTQFGCRHLVEDGSRPTLPPPWNRASAPPLDPAIFLFCQTIPKCPPRLCIT